jgi:two-component system, response regulator YesN
MMVYTPFAHFPADGSRTEPAHSSTDNPVIRRAREIAAHYELCTQIPCRIISREQFDNQEEDFCFCRIARDFPGERNGPTCGRNHLHSARQAERFGGIFIYFCSSFLIYWTSPIMREGLMEGAFVAGPAMIVTPEEVLEEWRKLYPALSDEVFQRYLREIPAITPERSKSLAEMLLMCAAWVTERGDSKLVESSAYQQQQARISEYIHELKTGRDGAGTVSYPIEKEQELLSAISRGSREQAQRLLNEILGNVFFSSGRNVEIIKFRIMELIVLLSRAAIDGGASPDDILTNNYRYLEEIGKFRDADSLAYWLSEVLNWFSLQVFNLQGAKHVDLLSRTLHYINSHYTEKITLEEAAEHAGLSPAYFSKIFKEEMNCSFTHYINRIRVDHAKTLLRTTPCTLVEIAGLVGFEDQSYFSRVFKNIAGISPGRYREHSGRGGTYLGQD